MRTLLHFQPLPGLHTNYQDGLVNDDFQVIFVAGVCRCCHLWLSLLLLNSAIAVVWNDAFGILLARIISLHDPRLLDRPSSKRGQMMMTTEATCLFLKKTRGTGRFVGSSFFSGPSSSWS
jgi:hypothetical protein